MKKCKTKEELKQAVIDNMNDCYDKYKDDMMIKFPDELWEACYEISLHRDLYTFLLYKVNHLPKSALQCMQKPDMFDTLKNDYYAGQYKPHYTEYNKLLEKYINKQQKMDMDGEM